MLILINVAATLMRMWRATTLACSFIRIIVVIHAGECERMVGKKYRLGLFYIPVGTYHFNLSFSIKIAERLLLVGLCFNIKMKYNKLLRIFKKKYIFFD